MTEVTLGKQEETRLTHLCYFRVVAHLMSHWSRILSEINEWHDTLRRIYPVRNIPAGSGI